MIWRPCAGRLGQPGALERGQVKGHGRPRHAKAVDDLPGRKAVGPLGYEQAHELEARRLSQGPENRSRVRRFHYSSYAEISSRRKSAGASGSSLSPQPAAGVVGHKSFTRHIFRCP